MYRQKTYKWDQHITQDSILDSILTTNPYFIPLSEEKETWSNNPNMPTYTP